MQVLFEMLEITLYLKQIVAWPEVFLRDLNWDILGIRNMFLEVGKMFWKFQEKPKQSLRF